MPKHLARRLVTAIAAGATLLGSLCTASVAHADYATPYQPLTVPGTPSGQGWELENPAPHTTGSTGNNVFGDSTGDKYADIWGIQWDGRWSKMNKANGIASFFSAVPPYMYHQQRHIDIMKYPGDIGYHMHNVTSLMPTVDLNGDKWCDFLAIQDGQMYAYYNQGSGYLVKGPQVGKNWSGMDQIIFAGQLNGDGVQYVVARSKSDGNLYGYTMGVDGALSNVGQIGKNWGGVRFILAPGQLVGDKKYDLMAIDNNGGLFCYRGAGLGKLSNAGQCGRGWNGFQIALVPGDMTGDGLWDLVGLQNLNHPTNMYVPQEGNNGNPTDRGPLYLYENLGNGRWGAKHMIGYDFYQYNVLG